MISKVTFRVTVRRQLWLQFSGLVVALLGGGFISLLQAQESESGQTAASQIQFIDELPDPSPFDSERSITEQLDWGHDCAFLAVQRWAGWFDGLFIDEGSAGYRTPISRFRLTMLGEVINSQGIDLGIDPEFDMDVNLPNAERQLKLFITTREPDELPGSEELFDEVRELRLGLRQRLYKEIDVDLGVRAEWPPDAFLRVGLSPEFSSGLWTFYPRVAGFWEVDEGFGVTGGFTADRWIGRSFCRTSTGLRWSEETEGLEWAQNLFFGHANQLIEEERMGQRARGRDIARGGGVRLTAEGHVNGAIDIDLYRVSTFLRFPIRDLCMYGVIAPEVSLRHEFDWEPEYGIRFGVDLLFWGLMD